MIYEDPAKQIEVAEGGGRVDAHRINQPIRLSRTVAADSDDPSCPPLPSARR
jgi:hypothetical protein